MESAEKTKDSRLARQLIVALPIELGRDDWLLLLRDFIQTECVDKGMCADFAIHDPDGHNPHAHITVTMRPLDAHGKWQSKTQKEYLCRSLIMLQYRLLVNRKRADTWKRQVNYYRPILQDYHAVTQQLTDKKSEQEQLQTNRSVLSPLQIVRRRQLAEQIAALTEEIEELRSRQAMILHNLDCKNNGEAQRFGSYLDKLEEMQQNLAAQRENLAQQLSATTKQYLEIENMIQPEDADAVHRHRTAMRKASTAEIYRQIQTTATVDDILFSKAEQRAEQITADTRNDAAFTRKPTEPTR